MANDYLTQVKLLNQRLTLNQKLAIASLGTLILFGFLSFAYLVRQQPYQLLFTNLEASGASAVIAKLKEMQVPYELSDGGSSISVPPERLAECRLEIASQGLPSSGRVGFELFDQGTWGVTDFVEKVNYRRALEGELEKTLLSLSEVVSARVHLVMEKDSLFERSSQPAKASVVVKLRPAASLSSEQVGGIQNLVAFSVEGLQRSNVTVVDILGNLLSSPPEGDQQLTQKQASLKTQFEADLRDKVTSILEPVVGRDNVRVTATVDLDHTETEQSEEIYDPDHSVVVSQQRTEQVYGDGGGPTGIPFKANDNRANPPPGVTGSGRTLQSEVVNYEVSKTLRQTRSNQAAIKRLSVAVVIEDKLVRTQNADGTWKEEFQPRSDEEMDQLRELVFNSVGFQSARGDSLSIQNMSFRPDATEKLVLPEPGFFVRNRDLINQSIRYLGIVALFLLFYLMVFNPVKRRIFAYASVDGQEMRQLAQATSDPELVQKLETKMAQLGATQAKALGAVRVSEEMTEIRRDLLTLAQKDPVLITQMIRQWLSE